MNNMSIYAVKLYKLNGIQWVFDDPTNNIYSFLMTKPAEGSKQAAFDTYRNRTRQLVFCEDYGIKPSDVWYLATSRDSYYKERRRMRWNDTARLCLTPLFEK